MADGSTTIQPTGSRLPRAERQEQPQERERGRAEVRREPSGWDRFVDFITPGFLRSTPEPRTINVIRGKPVTATVTPLDPQRVPTLLNAEQPRATGPQPLQVGAIDNVQAGERRIAELQRNLQTLGFFDDSYGPGRHTPGTFDDRTRRAVNDFARAYSGNDGATVPPVSSDGTLDERTRKALAETANQRRVDIRTGQSFDDIGRPTLRAGGGNDEDPNTNARARAKNMLRALGYDVSQGPVFDEGTMRALDRFQDTYEASVSQPGALGTRGALGPRMGEALRNALTSASSMERPWAQHTEAAIEEERRNNPLGARTITPANAKPADAAIIREVQGRLRELGYNFTNGVDINSRVAPSGRFDAQTQAAIADLQRLYSWQRGDMPANGQINAATLNLLRNREVSDALVAALPERMRAGYLLNGYRNGKPYPLVVRSMGRSPDGDNPSIMRDRYLETRAALAYTAAARIDPSIPLPGSGFRYYDEQAALRRQKGRLAAPAGYSEHQDGRALDVPNHNRAWLNVARLVGFRQHPAAGERHHFTLVTDDLTPAARRALGFRPGGREMEPVRTVRPRRRPRGHGVNTRRRNR